MVYRYAIVQIIFTWSFDLKSPKKVQNSTALTQIVMKVFICDPSDPNRNLTSISGFIGLSNFMKTVNFLVNSVFNNPHFTKYINDRTI